MNAEQGAKQARGFPHEFGGDPEDVAENEVLGRVVAQNALGSAVHGVAECIEVREIKRPQDPAAQPGEQRVESEGQRSPCLDHIVGQIVGIKGVHPRHDDDLDRLAVVPVVPASRFVGVSERHGLVEDQHVKVPSPKPGKDGLVQHQAVGVGYDGQPGGSRWELLEDAVPPAAHAAGPGLAIRLFRRGQSGSTVTPYAKPREDKYTGQRDKRSHGNCWCSRLLEEHQRKSHKHDYNTTILTSGL